MTTKFLQDIDLNGKLTLAGSGGTSGYVLQTNGSGAVSWAAPGTFSGGSIANRISVLSPGSGSSGGLTIRAATTDGTNYLQMTNTAETAQWYTLLSSATTATYAAGTAGTSAHVFNGAIQINSVNGLQINASNGAAAPIKLAAGTNIGTPAGGGVEYDGYVYYGTVNPNGGQNSRHILRTTALLLSTGNTISSGNSGTAYPFFGATGSFSGQGAYEFEIVVAITSRASSTMSFIMGGSAGISSIVYTSEYLPVSAGASTTTITKVWNTVATATAVSPATSTTGLLTIKGILKTTSIGTIVPQFSLNVTWSSSPVFTISGASYWKMTPLGNSSVATVGAFTV